MVDEGFNEISGCGIDKSVKLVKEIEQATDLNLFDRLKIQILEVLCGQRKKLII